MIRVDPQPEPPGFDDRVRQPGLRALAEDRNPLPAHWRECLNDLHTTYGGVCAYVSIYINKATGGRSVDHFVAKSSDPALAYEWANFRLACSLVNSRKGAFDDALDPFEVENDWFVLEFSFLQVYPNPELPAGLRQQIQDTIDRLRLDGQECRDARAEFFNDYIKGHIDFEYLERMCPFVALEVQRQGLERNES